MPYCTSCVERTAAQHTSYFNFGEGNARTARSIGGIYIRWAVIRAEHTATTVYRAAYLKYDWILLRSSYRILLFA